MLSLITAPALSLDEQCSLTGSVLPVCLSGPPTVPVEMRIVVAFRYLVIVTQC